MTLDRTRQLIFELDAFYRSHPIRQKDLAALLQITPQSLAEILSFRSRPNSETALRAVEFLKEQMNTKPKTLAEAREMLETAHEQIAQLKQAKSTPAAPAAPAKIVVPAPAAPAAAPPIPAAVAKTPTPPALMNAWETEAARAHAAATANLSSKPLAEQTVEQLRSALNAEKDPNVRARIYGILKAQQAQANDSPPFDPEKDLNNFKKLEVATPPPPKSLPVSANTPFLVGEILKVTNFEDLQSMLSNPVHTSLQRSMIYGEIKTRKAVEAGTLS